MPRTGGAFCGGSSSTNCIAKRHKVRPEFTHIPGRPQGSGTGDHEGRPYKAPAGTHGIDPNRAAFHRVIARATGQRQADIVLVDVGPNLGAINRAAIMAANHDECVSRTTSPDDVMCSPGYPAATLIVKLSESVSPSPSVTW